MYFIGLLIMTSGEARGVSSIISSWEAAWTQPSPTCPRNHVEGTSSILTGSSPILAWARGLGSEQTVTAQPGSPQTQTLLR